MPLETGARRRVRLARQPARQDGSSGPPPLTVFLIAFTVVIFIAVQHGFSNISVPSLARDGGVLAPPDTSVVQWVTATFLHANVLHIAMNMFSLWVLGRMVEPEVGAWRLLAIYVGAGVVGNAVAAYTQASGVVTVGASGAIFGLVGAAWMIAGAQDPARRRDVRRWVTSVVVLNLVLDLAIPNISIADHAGGFVGGLVLARVLGCGSPPRRTERGGGRAAG